MSGARTYTSNPGVELSLTLLASFWVTTSTEHLNSIITDVEDLLYFG